MNTLLDETLIAGLVKKHYLLGAIKRCCLIRRGFNDHYFIELEDTQFIFRVYLNHKYYIDSVDDFQFEVDFISHLDKKDIAVSTAVPLKTGALLGEVDTDLGNRTFALFNIAKGARFDPKLMTLQQSYRLGKTVGEFHLAANSFETTLKRYHLDLNYIVYEPLKLIAQQQEKKELSFVPEEDLKKFQRLVESLQPIDTLIKPIGKLNKNSDEYGIIHADLHAGNFHVDGEKITLFDFDHCAYGWRAYDLAPAFFLHNDLRKSLIEGYESIRPLSDNEKSCLESFSKLRQLWDIGDILASHFPRESP